MKKYGIQVAGFLLLRLIGFPQGDNLQKQINDQVWKPFIQSFKDDDNKMMMQIHCKELIRVVLDKGEILGYDQYFRNVPDSVKKNWLSWKKNIELRFTQRIAAKDNAFEVGYYKTTSKNVSTGETRVFYGKFHVLLRKESGTWKILMDEDGKEDTNEQIFLSGQPLELL